MHPSFIDTMDFMQNNVLQKIDAAHFGPGGDDDNQYTEDFLSGDSAMLFNGVWATGDFTDCEAGIDTENFTPSSSFLWCQTVTGNLFPVLWKSHAL